MNVSNGSEASLQDQSRLRRPRTNRPLQFDVGTSVLGVKTRAEVIRYYLRLMQWLIQQITQGGRILVERNGEVQSVIFPFLGKVAETAHKRLWLHVRLWRVGEGNESR